MSNYINKIIFLRKINTTYVRYASVSNAKIKTDLMSVKIFGQSKTFNISQKDAFLQTQSPFRKIITYVYYVDWDSGAVFTQKEHPTLLTPELLDFIVKANIVQQIARHLLRNPEKFQILAFLIGIFAGIIGGIFLAKYVIFANDSANIIQI